MNKQVLLLKEESFKQARKDVTSSNYREEIKKFSEEELLEDLKFWKELYNNYLDKAKNKDAPLTTLKNYIFKKRYYYYKLYFVECEILRRCSQ